jgi:hypothetical protein
VYGGCPEALHHVQDKGGLLASSEHYEQLLQLAVHKWKLVQKRMFTPTTTYSKEFPEGFFPVKDAIKATGLPVRELSSATAFSVDLGPTSAGLKASGLTTSFSQLIKKVLSKTEANSSGGASNSNDF